MVVNDVVQMSCCSVLRAVWFHHASEVWRKRRGWVAGLCWFEHGELLKQMRYGMLGPEADVVQVNLCVHAHPTVITQRKCQVEVQDRHQLQQLGTVCRMVSTSGCVAGSERERR